MNQSPSQIAQYNRSVILSATPARLLTMLYDRLVLDLRRAEANQEQGQWLAASEQIIHAQAIIAELESSLRTDEWDGAEQLLALYSYLSTALVSANLNRDIALTREAISLIEPLREAWQSASEMSSSTAERTEGANGVA